MKRTLYRRIGKRIFDLALTIPTLIVLSPVMAIVALLVRINLGSPVIFKHQRPGYKGRPFTMYKFRTMSNATDANGKLLPDADRLTAFGKFLRATSLDELPGLFNVLKGEMSLIGPRPQEMSYLGRYSDEQMRRHDVLPGISGWAQVNGRNLLAWERKFELDVWYVDNMSFWLDLKITLMTFSTLFSAEGITMPGMATTDDFMDPTPR